MGANSTRCTNQPPPGACNPADAACAAANPCSPLEALGACGGCDIYTISILLCGIPLCFCASCACGACALGEGCKILDRME